MGFAVLDSTGDLNLNEKQIFEAKNHSGLTAKGETTHVMTAILRNKNFFPAPKNRCCRLSLV